MRCWVGNCIRKACRVWELLKDEGNEEGGVGGMKLEAAAEMVEEWKEMIVALCVSSAIGIATVSIQIETKLPITFQFLSIVVLLCFGCVGFGKLTKSIFQRVSKILYCVGGFLGATAFFIATAIPYAPYFQLIVFLLYLIFCFTFMLITTTYNPLSSSSSSSTPL